jgi:bacillopeptidase F
MDSFAAIIFLSGILIAAPQTAKQNGPSVISESLDQQLRLSAPDEETSVLISLRNTQNATSYQRYPKNKNRQLIENLKARANQDQKALRLFLEQQGVTHVRSLWINNALAIRAGPAMIRRLARFPEVESIQPDAIVRLEVGDLKSDHPGVPQRHLEAIGAPALWSLGFDGTGIVVANMDTGVDMNHPDLIGRWRGGQNSWKDVHGQYPLPYDYSGHGTATMGIMVGGNYSGTVIGAAPGAQWIAVKIFDDNGESPYSRIHEGFQWLLDPDGNPDTPDAPDIVNNSWGLSLSVNNCVTEFQRDIEILKAAGIAVIFAAGNAGPLSFTSVSPANNRGVLSIGALDEAGKVAAFSSRGPSSCNGGIFPSLTAPGVNLKTADLTGGGAIPDSYAYVSGTSYATALVSGGMTLLMQALPDRDVERLEKLIFLSSSDSGQIGPDNQYGFGVLNLKLAYDYLSNICPEDFDRDYAVDSSDLAVFAEDWLRSECIACRGDLNDDYVVALRDFRLFAEHFGRNPCPSRCIGDIDFDFNVSLSDLSILAGEWLSVQCTDCQSDINSDGSIDFEDFFQLASQFGQRLCQ